MKIKICGFTNADNAKQAAALGIDAIGLVFYAKSPRSVEITTAVDIIAALPPFINRVGLFVNAETDFINKVLTQVPLDTLQFHGTESPNYCAQWSLPFIKALQVDEKTNIKEFAERYHHASGLLLDAFNPTTYGGSGQSFDWSLARVEIDLPIILAGGLSISTVEKAIKTVNPYALDISTGVESAKGIKDIDKIKQFISQVQK